MVKRGLWEIKGRERKPLREVVYDRLKKGIQRGDFKAGERLIEQRLAEGLGVSRTPIREAISRLEQDGLVYKIPQGGAVVKGTTKEEIDEIFGIRAVLESYAASLATKQVDDGVLSRLQKIIDRSQQALERGDVDGFIRLNTKFHEMIYRASHSDKLYQIISNLRDYFYKYRVFILKMEGMPQVSLQDHRRMLQAMREKDSKKVEELVREHILRGKESLLKEIDRGRLCLE
ncbi:MAG: GntR family transcriptional regulator [Deltaproteobacteria bacterium]|nr:MAG: GntR family transcriptional regulator [Deltaproteobacteria bacterium]